MGRVQGKVAFVTGAGRGQGRSHCVRLAEEGADIIAIDICENYATVGGPMSSAEDLAETVSLVRATGQRIFAGKADVRELDALRGILAEGVDELGRLDVVCANAGICVPCAWDEVSPEMWRDTIDTNLMGVWHTILAAAPYLIAGGGGSIICTSSTAGTKGYPYLAPYVAAKHGVMGLAKTFANELAAHNIRVNTVNPTGVNTPMVEGFGGHQQLLDRDPRLGPIYMNTMDVEMIEPEDVSQAVLFLASDESRYVTGLEFKIDAGNTLR